MGGAKKRSMSQIEKQQQVESKKGQKSQKKKTSFEKKIGGFELPKVDDKTLSELSKIGAITPFVVANKYGLKLSVAKHFLKSLEQNGEIELVAGNPRINVYKLVRS